MPAERRSFAVIGAAGALDAGAILLLGARPYAWILLPAGLLHLAAVVAVLQLRRAELSRRLLAATMTFSLPLIGIAMAVLVMRVRGQGTHELLARSEPARHAVSGEELARRLTAGGPACEALLVGDAETRHAVVSALQRAADARAITLLRWAIAQADPDPALEAALALEELSARYLEQSAEARAEAERRPSRDTALAAAEVIASAIHNGLADPELMPAIAAQARDYYRMAARLDEPRAGELIWARARLELAMLDPEAALALLEPVLAANTADERVRELYRDAAHAARRFELLPAVEPLPVVHPLGPEPPLAPPVTLTAAVPLPRPEDQSPAAAARSAPEPELPRDREDPGPDPEVRAGDPSSPRPELDDREERQAPAAAVDSPADSRSRQPWSAAEPGADAQVRPLLLLQAGDPPDVSRDEPALRDQHLAAQKVEARDDTAAHAGDADQESTAARDRESAGGVDCEPYEELVIIDGSAAPDRSDGVSP